MIRIARRSLLLVAAAVGLLACGRKEEAPAPAPAAAASAVAATEFQVLATSDLRDV
jgi:predicted outer membrane protein